MTIRIHGKENLYFAIKAGATVLIVGLLAFLAPSLLGRGGGLSLAAAISTVSLYAIALALFFLFQKLGLVALLKGNGICVSEGQFPEVHSLYLRMAAELGVRKAPKLFVLQEGGFLNAFALRFSRKNYIAVYSDVFELMNSDMDALAFVLGHELGHVKRHHMSKRFWTFPSSIIPFLTAAYSRSCEYSCDNIGAAVVQGSPLGGLVLLAAGKGLYRQVNVEEYLRSARENRTAAVRFMGLFMSHPYLPDRIGNLSGNTAIA